jgi:hypothetical protein
MCGVSLNKAEVVNSRAKHMRLDNECSLEREGDSFNKFITWNLAPSIIPIYFLCKLLL